MNLVLLGPPGAGKGTQAVRIAKSLGLLHLSSGDILRAERKSQSELGRKAQDYMDRGVLVPDDLILAMMIGQISRAEASRGFILDGFPRTVTQAEGLDQRLGALSAQLDMVVNMVVDDSEVSQRLTGRWSCPKDGRPFHDVFSPPKVGGVCDDCGTALTRRKDDEPEVVAQRLRTYHAETKPLVSYYTSRGILTNVVATGSVDRVTELIERVCRAT